MTYQDVDPKFGDWEDVKALGAEYDLQMECMVNHISPASKEFQDYLAKGDKSEFRDLFIDWNKLWGGGPYNRTRATKSKSEMHVPRQQMITSGTSDKLIADLKVPYKHRAGTADHIHPKTGQKQCLIPALRHNHTHAGDSNHVCTAFTDAFMTEAASQQLYL